MFRRFWETYRNAYSGLPREVWLQSTILLINRSGSMVLMFLPLYLTKRLHFSDIEIGLLIGGCYGIGSIVGALAGGRLTSQFGPIHVQVFSQAFAVLGYLLLATANSFRTVAIALFFLSIISEMVRPATYTATTLFCPEHSHKKAMGHNRLAVNLGMALGGAIGGLLAGINYELLFFANATTVFCAFLATLFFFRLKEPVAERQVDELKSNGSPLRDWRYLVFLFLSFLTSIVFFQLLSTYPKYLDEHLRINEFELGLLMAINTMVIVAVEMLLLQLVRNLNVLRTIGIGSFLSCIGFGLLPLGNGIGFIAFTVLIWTAGEMLAMPLSGVFAASRSSHANRGRYMGMFVSSYSVALVVAPLAGMAIYQVNPDMVWYTALGLSLVVLIGFFALSYFDDAVVESSDKLVAEKQK